MMIYATVKTVVTVLFLAIFIVSCGKKETDISEKNSNEQQKSQNILSQSEKKTDASLPAATNYVKSIENFDEFNSIIDNSPGELLVFDLYADWCRPCKLLAPVYDTLAKMHVDKATFYRVDVQNKKDIASAFQVQSIPLVVFIKDKEILQMIPGFNPREHYEKIITACGSSVPVSECIKELKSML